MEPFDLTKKEAEDVGVFNGRIASMTCTPAGEEMVGVEMADVYAGESFLFDVKETVTREWVSKARGLPLKEEVRDIVSPSFSVILFDYRDVQPPADLPPPKK